MWYEEEVTPYKRKKKKPRRPKANHKHQFEPVILQYYNKHKSYTREKGFIGDTDYCGGRRCTVCGLLHIGFPDDSKLPAMPFMFNFRHQLLAEYSNLPIIKIEDIWATEIKEAE